jgi:hypothetical protein
VPSNHGLHGHDVLVAPDGTDNTTFVYVDPGHTTLIHAIRQHASPVAAVVVPPGPYTKRRRVLLKQHALAQKNQSEFVLTNRHWRHETKKDWVRIKRLKLDAHLNLQPAVDQLAAAFPSSSSSSSSSSSMPHSEYLLYTRVKLATMEVFDVASRLRAPRRWKLETYQAEQRAAEQLCSDVQAGLSSDVSHDHCVGSWISSDLPPGVMPPLRTSDYRPYWPGTFGSCCTPSMERANIHVAAMNTLRACASPAT